MKSLRIFYAADHTPNGFSLPTSQIWYCNLYLPLVDLGHDVIPFRYDLTPHLKHADPADARQRAFIEQYRPGLEESLLKQVWAAHRQEHVDVFFSYFYSALVRPDVIREIGAWGITTMNWYCNASYQFHLVEEIAPAYHYCLVPEKFRLEDYKATGANPIYCQEAANPNIYKPYPLPREFDVTFVGAQYADRADYVRYLRDHHIDVRVWGAGWKECCPPPSLPRWLRWRAGRAKGRLLGQPVGRVALPRTVCGDPLSDEEMVQMYSRSKISLGFSNVGETHRATQPIKQIRLRDFEAPMSGAFYVTEYMPELEEFFRVGKEIVCYHDKADLADKVKYYLAHTEERETIRQAGYRRAVSEHTWQKRFQQVFQQIGVA